MHLSVTSWIQTEYKLAAPTRKALWNIAQCAKKAHLQWCTYIYIHIHMQKFWQTQNFYIQDRFCHRHSTDWMNKFNLSTYKYGHKNVKENSLWIWSAIEFTSFHNCFVTLCCCWGLLEDSDGISGENLGINTWKQRCQFLLFSNDKIGVPLKKKRKIAFKTIVTSLASL